MPTSDDTAVQPVRRRPLRWMMGRWRDQPGSRRLLLTEAVAWLAYARIALVAVSFRKLAARFGVVRVAGTAAAPRPALTQQEAVQAREVSWAVTRAAKYVPFRAVCLPQAIAAKAMLDRRHVASVMHFGVARHDCAPMDAHAWLDAGDIEVTGFPIRPDFVEVVCFE
jgi:hypothetical protein